jgi:hypothetical protein
MIDPSLSDHVTNTGLVASVNLFDHTITVTRTGEVMVKPRKDILDTPSLPVELAPVGFRFRGQFHELTGRPKAMLEILLASRGRSATAEHLRQAMGINDEFLEHPEQAVIDTAKKLRAALREAAKAACLDCKDPLPHTGKGRDLAYRLTLPEAPR